jgi:hemerythrin
MPTDSAPMQFGPGLRTGVALIDDQHQVLFDLINRIDEYLLGNATDATALLQTVEDLVHYAIYHLMFEERLVARMGYQYELDTHCLAHDEFRRKVNHFREAAQGKTPVPAVSEFQAYLKAWLVKHILHSDVPLFRKIGEQSTMASLEN